MSNQARIEQIQARLQSSLKPTELEIRDDSHLHAGHPGARDGRGHFHVRIVSEAFEGQRPLARHRQVFDALGEMMDSDIHALQIDARSPGE